MSIEPLVRRAGGAEQVRPAGRPLELSVVIPTFEERDNVSALLERLEIALEGLSWEVVLVDDDSPDGTWRLAKQVAAVDPRVSCIRRVGRRGLAGAVVEGAMASAAPFIAVMDADLQHDEALLPEMLRVLRQGAVDVVIGSRYLRPDAGVVAGLAGSRRRLGSRLANWLGRKALAQELTDPVSGFFMLRREVVDGVAGKLATNGFKVLFDILATQPTPARCVELPYEFRPRNAGRSKLDHGVVAQYLSLIAAKLTRDVLSPRAVMFGLVGASGVAVHLAVLRTLLPLGFTSAQAAAALTAMTSNYLINNAVTYRSRRKRGLALLTGYLKFCLLCSAGLAANIGVASALHDHAPIWWLAGLAGAAVGAAWNFTTTSIAVW